MISVFVSVCSNLSMKILSAVEFVSLFDSHATTSSKNSSLDIRLCFMALLGMRVDYNIWFGINNSGCNVQSGSHH